MLTSGHYIDKSCRMAINSGGWCWKLKPGESVLLHTGVNGKTCQWNTRREPVNKQNW